MQTVRAFVVRMAVRPGSFSALRPGRRVIPKAVNFAVFSAGGASKNASSVGFAPGPAAFDIVDAQRIERFGRSPVLSRTEKSTPPGLRAVPQRGVEQIDALVVGAHAASPNGLRQSGQLPPAGGCNAGDTASQGEATGLASPAVPALLRSGHGDSRTPPVFMPDAPAPVSSILDLIGNTPLVEATCFDTGPCRLFLKLESQNPGGSIKDRVALSMIQAAAREAGDLKPGGTIVEATAGNTGLGLALLSALRGYRCILVVPDKMSQEKIFHLKALVADVRLTRSDVVKGHPDYYQEVAARLVQEIPGAWWANQFGNPANPKAHEAGTGP